MNVESPNLSLFRAHLEEAPFTAGADLGRWGLVEGEELAQWPSCRLWVRSDARFIANGHVVLRFNLEGYPASAPTSHPWDNDSHRPLQHDRWPKGSPRVNAVFNPGWNQNALYMPCDRAAMGGHDGWKHTFPQWWWTSTHTITDYLTFVARCLNPSGHE